MQVVNVVHHFTPANAMNSARADALSFRAPRSADVTVVEPCLLTPREHMQKWVASMMTPTPTGSKTSWMALAT